VAPETSKEAPKPATDKPKSEVSTQESA
jgi:hypothetical protein